MSRTYFAALALCLASSVQAAEYPDMQGVWIGTVRTVTSGEQVRAEVARGGAVIAELALRFTVRSGSTRRKNSNTASPTRPRSK